MSRTRAKFEAQTLGYRYGEESVMRLAPVQFYDDFIGQWTVTCFPSKGIDVERWAYTETNLNKEIEAVLNAANGIVRFIADADNNAEEGTIHFGDNLLFRLNQGLIFECRAAMSTLPTTVGAGKTAAIFGLGSARGADPDAFTINCWFKLDGTADILWETDDNTVNDDDNDTLVNAVAGVYHIFRIDCTDWTTPKFYVDGVLVGTGNMAALAAPSVQPIMGVYKVVAANTSLGTLDIDYVRIWQNRS